MNPPIPNSKLPNFGLCFSELLALLSTKILQYLYGQGFVLPQLYSTNLDTVKAHLFLVDPFSGVKSEPGWLAGDLIREIKAKCKNFRICR